MILVDPAVWPFRGRKWAHLVSDTSYDELHEFAAQLGLPSRAFHRDHYDIPAELREEALALGATAVSARVVVQRLQTSGLRQRKTRELAVEVGARTVVGGNVEQRAENARPSVTP